MYYSFDVIKTSFFYEIIYGALMFSVVLFGSCKREVGGLWPDKNWFMLLFKFLRQEVVLADFLKSSGDSQARGNLRDGQLEQEQILIFIGP